VCSPNKTHKEIALAAIAAGKHVFCEKPFSIGVADAAELREAANAGKGVFQVGHNRRYAPVYATLKELLKNDSAHSAHIKMNRGELKNPVWTGDVNVTGGFLHSTNIRSSTNFRSYSNSRTVSTAHSPRRRTPAGTFLLSASRSFATTGR
jgi:predicted dehydrogenase